MDIFMQPGNVVEFTAPVGGVYAGIPKQIGQLIVVPVVDANEGAAFNAYTTGVFSLRKAAPQAWAEGDRIFWDENNQECTKVAGALPEIGICVRAVDSGVTKRVGRVRLLPLVAPITAVDTPPASPVDGQIWFSVDGTSPSRTLSINLRDDGNTITVPLFTF